MRLPFSDKAHLLNIAACTLSAWFPKVREVQVLLRREHGREDGKHQGALSMTLMLLLAAVTTVPVVASADAC